MEIVGIKHIAAPPEAKHRLTAVVPVALGLFFAVLLTAVFIRCFLGVDTSDETFYAAESYLYAHENVPYVDGWFNAAGFGLFLSALTRLFISVTGTTSGIILFLRLASTGLKLLLLVTVFFLILPASAKKPPSVKRRCAFFFRPEKAVAPALFVGALFALMPHSLIIFSYNTMSLYLMLLGGALLFAANTTSSPACKILSFAAGVVFAACAFVYPTQAISCVIVFAITLLCCILRRRRNRSPLFFALGGLAAALGAVAFLVLKGGGLAALAGGLRMMTQENQYFNLSPNHTPAAYLQQLAQPFTGLLPAIIVFFAVSLLGAVFVLLRPHLLLGDAKPQKSREGKAPASFFRKWLLGAALIALFFTVGQAVWYGTKSLAENPGTLMFRLSPFPPALYLFFGPDSRKKHASLLSFIWAPSVVLALVAALGSGGLATRQYFLGPAGLLVLLFIGPAVKDTFGFTPPARRAASFLCLFGGFAITAAMLLHNYGYVYRDAPFKELNARIPTGIYAGMYTTFARRDMLLEMEDTLRKYVTPQDTVLFLDWAPYGYLMTEAIPFTPSTSDLAGFSISPNPSAYYTYFKLKKDLPAVIVYADTGTAPQRQDVRTSLELDGYAFNAFLQENYHLAQAPSIAGDAVVFIFYRNNHYQIPAQ